MRVINYNNDFIININDLLIFNKENIDYLIKYWNWPKYNDIKKYEPFKVCGFRKTNKYLELWTIPNTKIYSGLSGIIYRSYDFWILLKDGRFLKECKFRLFEKVKNG